MAFPSSFIVAMAILLSPTLTLHQISFAQSPAGYLSIDCGSSQTSNYTDALGIPWAPDRTIWPDIDSWSSTSDITPPADDLDRSGGARYRTLRYFPPPTNASTPSTLNQAKFCYSLPARGGGYYVVRATFWYGTSPTTTLYSTRIPGLISFHMIVDTYIGPQVNITLPQTSPTFYEMYIQALSGSSSVSLCFSAASDDNDIPFVNSLELRPLPEAMTPVAIIGSTNTALRTVFRADFGASADAPSIIRYPNDTLDRVWFTFVDSPTNRTSDPVGVAGLPDSPPLSVVQTSWTGTDKSLLVYNLSTTPPGIAYRYYISLFFAELDPNVNASGLRVFDGTVNGNLLFQGLDVYEQVGQYGVIESYSSAPFGPYADYVVINLTSTASSVYPPSIAAAEIIRLFDNPMVPATSSVDISGIQGLTSTLSNGLSRFTGDPCLPAEYKHPWLTCTGEGILPTRVVSISLSNSTLLGSIPASINDLDQIVHLLLDGNALEGPIPTDLGKLVNLQVLNLSNNRLSGPIPESLANLPKLTELDLRNNNLSGEIPPTLQQKASSGKLTFKYDGNSFLCLSSNVTCSASTTPSSSSDNTPAIIGAVFGVIIGCTVISIIVCCILCKKCKKRKKHGENQAQAVPTSTVHNQAAQGTPSPTYPAGLTDSHDVSHTKVLEATNVAYCFTFQEIITITNDFSTILGKGGFGSVYKGTLPNGIDVAVKVMSEASQHGAHEFLNEVTLLSRVHHKNLVGLTGYCIEKKLILVYEYMSNGSLFDSLFGKTSQQVPPLKWIERLYILLDAAQGLAYLHHGCSSLIIHMDVKSSNILMTKDLEGKMSDFGISRTSVGRDQLTTKLMGTMGYFDPEYALTSILSEKIDIYSFGVVLFEAVCGKLPLMKDREHPEQDIHIADWARPYYERGAIEEIVDRNIGYNYNISSIWKVAETAFACTQFEGKKRPTMNKVCSDLIEALRLEAKPDTVSAPNTGECFPMDAVNAR